MKKIALYFYGILLVFIYQACTEHFDDINKPGNKLSPEELQRDNYAVGSFLIQMQGIAFPEQENAYQTMIDFVGNYLGRYTTYTKVLPKNHTLFNASNSWKSWPASYAPAMVSAFEEVEHLDGKNSLSYAWALILRAQAFLRFTDIYGPFPMDMEGHRTTVYASQKDIYIQLIQDLSTASEYIAKNTELEHEGSVYAPYDFVYKGDFNKWRKFANSLKLRIAIRISNVEPEIARLTAEEAVRDGVIENNQDNCLITYNKSGLWVMSSSWGDSRICADIESYMTGYKDPRINAYFLPTTVKEKRTYVGCRAGAPIESNVLAKRIYSAVNVSQSTPGIWLTASEMLFCKAEGTLRGWNMGETSAKELYEKAIGLSFEQWNVGGVEKYLNDSTSVEADYEDALGGFGVDFQHVSDITIKWEDDVPLDIKMERLITQKWIALYPNGQEAWNEIRRTGFPKIFPIPQIITEGNLLTPNRIPFDNNEQVNNRDNYRIAVQLLGGPDNYETKMWWQR